jgi:ketosteroid isomerase-like protein
VRSILAAWARGDFSSSDWADEDIEFVIAEGPAPGRWHGLAGLSEGFRGLVNAWDDYRVEGVDYLELDGERVLVSIRPTGRGKSSGLELGQTLTIAANLFEVTDGKVTRLVLYFDRDRALAEVEQGDSAD